MSSFLPESMTPFHSIASSFSAERVLPILFVLGYFATGYMCTWLVDFIRECHAKRHRRHAGGCCQESDALSTKATTDGDKAEDTSHPIDDMWTCRSLPEDLCGRISVYCGHEGVGALSACSNGLLEQFWESSEVWYALAANASLGNDVLSKTVPAEARDSFRRGFFRTDMVQLRCLAKAGRSHAILDEAAHVACGLYPGDLEVDDLADFIQIGSRCLGAHDPESSKANRAARRLIGASRRYIEIFTEEQLEHLEYAYKSVHQLHALMLASMSESREASLEQSAWTGLPDTESFADADEQELYGPDVKEFELCNDEQDALHYMIS